MTKKTLHIWLALLIISLCFSFVLPVLASSDLKEEEQAAVWKFDYRETFYDIAFPSKQKGVIVGARGRILVTHGTYKNLWSPRDSKTEEMLTSLSFIDEKQGWAAGYGGVIVHTVDGGENWEVQREASSQNLPLFDIQFVSENTGYACGAYDTLLKTVDGGKSWNSQPTGFDNIYNSLYFLDARNGFMVGEFGTLLKTSNGGESWQQIDLDGYQGALFGITVLSREKVLAYGITGKLIISHDGGTSWKDISVDSKDALFMAATNKDDVIIVGRSGLILRSNDGAKRFTQTYETDNNSFAGVCSDPKGGFVGVGEFGKISKIKVLRNE